MNIYYTYCSFFAVLRTNAACLRNTVAFTDCVMLAFLVFATVYKNMIIFICLLLL